MKLRAYKKAQNEWTSYDNRTDIALSKNDFRRLFEQTILEAFKSFLPL